MVGVCRRPGAQCPAWSGVGVLVAIGGPGLLTHVHPEVRPAIDLEPTPPPPPGPARGPCLASPPGPRPLRAPAAVRPVSAQTAHTALTPSCSRPPGGHHWSPRPKCPGQQALSLPEPGGQGLRSGVGAPSQVPGMGALPLVPSPPRLCPVPRCPLAKDTAAGG